MGQNGAIRALLLELNIRVLSFFHGFFSNNYRTADMVTLDMNVLAVYLPCSFSGLQKSRRVDGTVDFSKNIDVAICKYIHLPTLAP